MTESQTPTPIPGFEQAQVPAQKGTANCFAARGARDNYYWDNILSRTRFHTQEGTANCFAVRVERLHIGSTSPPKGVFFACSEYLEMELLTTTSESPRLSYVLKTPEIADCKLG